MLKIPKEKIEEIINEAEKKITDDESEYYTRSEEEKEFARKHTAEFLSILEEKGYWICNSPQAVWLNIILEERQKQDQKWGEQNHVLTKWMTILQEEVGEAAKAVLEVIAAPGDDEKMLMSVISETVQVAAVAVAFLECMGRQEANRREEKKPRPENGWQPGQG